MLSYCLKCSKNTESKNQNVVTAKNKIIILLSKCVEGDNKISKFIKHQEAGGLLSSLGIRTPFRKIPLVGPLLFQIKVNTFFISRR